MVRADNFATLVQVDAAAQLADRQGRVEECLCRDGAQAANEFGVHQLQLSAAEARAIVRLFGERIAIAGRATLKDVHDVHILASHFASFDNLGQKLARASDKGFAHTIFVSPRRFTKKHKPRGWISHAEHGLLARRSKLRATSTGRNLVCQNLERGGS